MSNPRLKMCAEKAKEKMSHREGKRQRETKRDTVEEKNLGPRQEETRQIGEGGIRRGGRGEESRSARGKMTRGVHLLQSKNTAKQHQENNAANRTGTCATITRKRQLRKSIQTRPVLITMQTNNNTDTN